MEVKASGKFIRIAPRKARAVIDLIRGKNTTEALAILDFAPRKSSKMISKILRSAIANAEHNNKLDVDSLFVAKAFVDEGATIKRFRPRAMGRASQIRKRTSHITVVLEEKKEG